jgi:dephospho-CoA kinase
MKRVLVTGMSGTGKSTIIQELQRRGYKAIDTDWDSEWEEPPATPSDGPGWLWREAQIGKLLDAEDADVLFVGACVENQARFYQRFDHIVLLSASTRLTRERLARRTTNPYGQLPGEMDEVLRFKATIEPRLRRSATVEIDTGQPLRQVVDAIVRLIEPD